MNAIEKWATSWEASIHQTEDQQKRLASSKAASCTPSVLDKDNCCAHFHGRRGNYETCLDNCTCADFLRRQLPCKHIYRLAIELDVLGGSVSAYTHGGYSWKEVVEIIEAYPLEVQEEFLLHFHSSTASADPYKRKKSPEMDVLIENGVLIEDANKETPKFKTVRLIEDFLKDKRNISWYFSRKFRKPNVFNGIDMEYEPLPDDEITAYLRQRGFCLDIPIKSNEDLFI